MDMLNLTGSDRQLADLMKPDTFSRDASGKLYVSVCVWVGGCGCGCECVCASANYLAPVCSRLPATVQPHLFGGSQGQ
jgi:hypothetical protein